MDGIFGVDTLGMTAALFTVYGGEARRP